MCIDYRSPARHRSLGLKHWALALAIGGALAAGPAGAQSTADGESGPVTEQLIRALVANKALTRVQAENLIKTLRQQQAAAPAATATASASPDAGDGAASAPGNNAGDVRVIYVPEKQKQQMREEIKKDVLAQAEKENWAQPSALPEWTKRFHFFGDFRLRGQADIFDESNAAGFIDYEAINEGEPVDITLGPASGEFPYINTTEDRYRPRLRARFGFTADITDRLDATFRLATGDGDDPVSANVTLNNDFNKFPINLDQAFFNWEPTEQWQIMAGRTPNPWVHTRMVWDDDLMFDGISVNYHESDHKGLFATAGAYAIDQTNFDFPSNLGDKEDERFSYLLGAQVGNRFEFTDNDLLTTAVAYYHYDNVQGQSSTCITTVPLPCPTDDSRATERQFGNTLYALRVPRSGSNNTANFQYFGRASKFHEVNVTAAYDHLLFGGEKHVGFTLDYVRNVAFDESEINELGFVNNFGANDIGFDGGSNGYNARATFGDILVTERGNWSLTSGYKYIESDAVYDAFNESNFHLGGTNAKGYYLLGQLGLAHNTWAVLNYMSTSEVSGRPFAVDTVQLDLNARF